MSNTPKLKDAYVAIHGHFYQPLRENPWLGIIDIEESPYLFHDWSKRIALLDHKDGAWG
jgi:alpha-amylase/alpha-mannosidase (GH57 family)